MPDFSCVTFRSIALLSVLITTCCCGCGRSLDTDYSSLNLATAYGTVTSNGSPLAGVTVVFEAEDKTYSSGVTDSSGYYKLMFNSEKEGVTPGPKTVRISYTSGEDEIDYEFGEEDDPDGKDAEDGGASSAESIPPKYNVKSELTAVIEAGDSHKFDFDLVM